MLKRNRAKFSKSRPKVAKFWWFLGAGGQVVQKLSIFTAKGTSLPKSASFKPFCVTIGWGVWPPGVLLKKKVESHRSSHWNDVSPLTQGCTPVRLWCFSRLHYGFTAISRSCKTIHLLSINVIIVVNCPRITTKWYSPSEILPHYFFLADLHNQCRSRNSKSIKEKQLQPFMAIINIYVSWHWTMLENFALTIASSRFGLGKWC